MIDSLDTGQTEHDIFYSKPIDPELDDSEQLTSESMQPHLSLVGQLQWLVTLGRPAIHAQVTTLSMFRSTPRKHKGPMVISKRSLNSIGFSLNSISVNC